MAKKQGEPFGAQLKAMRERAGLSARSAATEAGFSEALWRQYERGERQVTKDVAVPVTPTAKNVERAARAVGWDPAEALIAAGLVEEAKRLRERAASEQRNAERSGLSVVPPIVEPVMVAEDDDNDVLSAIRRDPDLDEPSRAHFLNQYQLLRALSRMNKAVEGGERPDLLPYVAHGKRTEPVDLEEERRIEEMAREAARNNPHSPYRDK